MINEEKQVCYNMQVYNDFVDFPFAMTNIEDFEFDNNSKKSIIEQIEEFAKENEITLEEGWKVKIAKRYVSKERNDNKDIVEKWKALFNGLLENSDK